MPYQMIGRSLALSGRLGHRATTKTRSRQRAGNGDSVATVPNLEVPCGCQPLLRPSSSLPRIPMTASWERGARLHDGSAKDTESTTWPSPVSYTHLRAHETDSYL